MKTNISDIATVLSGIYAKPDLHGEVYYLQAKHFNKDREFDPTVEPDLEADGKILKHMLQAGDVLLAAKGHYNFAVHYKGIRPAVASSMFIIIRLNDKRAILPQYLKWYLNLNRTQIVLSKLSRGTALPSLTKSQVEQLVVEIPTLEKQEIIVKLEELKKLESRITFQLQELKEQATEKLLLKAIK